MADNNQTQNQQTQQQDNSQQAQGQTQQAGGAPAIDYEKLAAAASVRAAAAEDAALKNYLKQQGLTPEEAAQAMAAFKEQKAKNTPDPAALQQQVADATAAAMRSAMENKALLMASDLGEELKTMPYVLKMADLSGAVVNGAVDDEKLKAALTKVLEDIPALKTVKAAEQKPAQQNAGFQVGSVQTGNAGGGIGTDHKQLPMKDAIAAKLQGQIKTT